jgi:hypothetical protein
MNTDYLKARLKEPSTWRGLALCLTAFGIAITPDQIESIVVVGLLISGLIGAGVSDK